MSAEHPDDLLARRESLSDAERVALDAHLAACATCSFERAFQRDLDALSAGRPDEAVAAALRSLDRAPTVTPLRRALPRGAWLVAAALTAVALTAIAAGALRARPTPPPQRSNAPSPPVAAPPVAAPAPIPSRPTPRATPPATPAPSADPPAPSAAELYRRGNTARHARRDAEARRHYEALLRAHPGSREAAQARASLARLLLDRGEDLPRAAALFAQHLRESPGAADEEAAMAGRARALERLGRRDDERAQWESLLARYPSSLHAAAARARVEALR